MAAEFVSAQKHLSKVDPMLKSAIKKIGDCRLQKGHGGFHVLAETIVHQQLSLKAAGTIFARLKEAAGKITLTPESLVSLTDEQFRSSGISRPKIKYLRDLAVRVGQGELKFASFPKMTDDEIRDALCCVKGIGVWSANMYLIFVLNRLDVLPTNDVGLINAISLIYGIDEMEIDWDSLRNRWTPYCSIASWYLWAERRRRINK